MACKDLLAAEPQDRILIAEFYQGYAAGLGNTTLINPKTLDSGAEGLLDACNSAPSRGVLATIERFAPEPTPTPCVYSGSPFFTSENPCP